MEIVTFRSSTPASAVGKANADSDGYKYSKDKAAAVISRLSATEIHHLLAPVEQGLVEDNSMLHCRVNGEELIISASDLRQVAEERANRAEKSYDTIIQTSLEPTPQGELSTFASKKNHTNTSERIYASIHHESYAYIAVKALHRRLCSLGGKLIIMSIALIFIIAAVILLCIFFNRQIQHMIASPPSIQPIPTIRTYTNFSISAKLLDETIIFPNITGAYQMMPPLAYIDSQSGEMVLSFTRRRNWANSDRDITDQATVFTTEKGIQLVNRSANYIFTHNARYSAYLQCFDVTGNENIVAYCCIDRASQLSGSFIHCTGPNDMGQPVMNALPHHGSMVMTDWIKVDERMILVYLIISDRVTLVLHPDRYINVPFSAKISESDSNSLTLNAQVFISTATKIEQSDLTFAILLVVHTNWPPTYYVCSYKLIIKKYEVIALECTALPDLYNLIRNMTETLDDSKLPEAYVDKATISPSGDIVYLVHVPATFFEYFGSDSYGYKDIAAFSSNGALIGIDSLPYKFPVVGTYIDLINNAFAGNLNFCFSSMRFGPQIPEVDKADDPDDKYTLLSAMNVYSYAAKVCIKDTGECFEIEIGSHHE